MRNPSKHNGKVSLEGIMNYVKENDTRLTISFAQAF